ncbi:MAG: M56 family metallopeptidase, partial [Sphingomicrobium sp.]
APLVLPSWNVETPALLGSAPETAAAVQPAAAGPVVTDAAPVASIDKTAFAASKPMLPPINPAAAVTAIYAVPAAVLLLITFLALARLITLRARADVLVDGHWLSALARAQRRMGFKHGTALLTSDELASPISWGLMRPVILLNSRAVEAADEAEAIIAHELAHVARMDWIKLLLARVATALFWFNPLVWLLAREAHQLREETADDTVLGADIVDTDYAQLLVGVARHECPGLLLGAHGVAPSKSSLARRVARVLDGKSVRGPVARSFALGVFAGAIMVAAPLAALTLTPATLKTAKPASKATANEPAAPPYAALTEAPTDLPHIIAKGVSTSVTTAVAAATAIAPQAVRPIQEDFHAEGPNGATVDSVKGTIIARSPSGAESIVYPPDAHGRRMIVAKGPNGARAVTYVDDGDVTLPSARPPRQRGNNVSIDRVIEMRAVGITPEYLAAIRSASPAMRGADLDDVVGMRAVGVTPEFIRGMATAGLTNLDADELTQARAVGLTPDYVRQMAAAGFRGDIDDYVEMRAVGVTPAYAEQFRKSGYRILGAKQLIKFKAHGITAETLRSTPRPPQPLREPTVNPGDDDGG